MQIIIFTNWKFYYDILDDSFRYRTTSVVHRPRGTGTGREWLFLLKAVRAQTVHVQELVTFLFVFCAKGLKSMSLFRFNKCVLLNWRTMEEKVISRVEECLVFVASVFDFLYAHRVSCDVFITSPFYINKYTSYNLHCFCCTDPWLESDVELQAVPLRTVGTSELVSGGCTCG